MIMKKDNTPKDKIEKAAAYFITELHPQYDYLFELNSETPISLPDFNTIPTELHLEISEKFVRLMKEKSNKLDKERKILETKKEKFEILKEGFDGFDLKEMDNIIKKNKKEMIQRKKIKNF